MMVEFASGSIEKVLYLVNSKIKNREIKIIRDTPEIHILGLENEFVQGFQNIKNANEIQLQSVIDIASVFSVNKK